MHACCKSRAEMNVSFLQGESEKKKRASVSRRVFSESWLRYLLRQGYRGNEKTMKETSAFFSSDR